MQRLKGRILVLGALAVLACSVDPTDNQGTPTEITATPEVVFVTQGDSQAVIATAVDEDGQVLEADFTASNVGSGITVVEDPTFLGTTTGVGIRRQARFFVKGVDLTATSFTLNALGLTKEISVTSVPGDLAATFSNLTPALGDTISITAPTGTFFTEGSVLTFGGLAPFVVTQDASTIVFIPRPNTDGPAVVSAVGVTSNPALTFDLATPDTLRTDAIVDIGANLAPTSPALGGAVTLTLPAGLRLIPESLATLTVENAPAPPRDRVLSADSTTITFVPSPNADSFVVVTGVTPERLAQCCSATRIEGTDTLPGYTLQLRTTARVTTPVVENVPSTVSDAAPDVNEAVTITSTDANFTFLPTAGVTVGATAAVVTGVAGDGSSVTFIAPPGTTGALTVSGVDVVGFPLTLPSTAGAITVSSTVTPLAGTDDPSTAPALPVPAAAGESTVTFDDATFTAADITADGGVSAQYYTITVAAEATFTISISSSDGGPDLDGVICGDGTCADVNQQDFTLASVAHDESDSVTLAAGTHLLALVNFDGATTDWVNVTITRE